jgi:hypothetical protein
LIENKLIEKCEVEDVKDCQAAMLAKFGETITLQKIPQGYHEIKAPIGELFEVGEKMVLKLLKYRSK